MSLMQMSLLGGALILFIVVVRALALHRLPKTAFLALWEIAALRLLLPFSIQLPFSVPAPIEHLAAVGTYLTAADVPTNAVPTGMPSSVPVPANTAAQTVLPVVWLTGVILTAAYFLVCYVRVRRRFGTSHPDNTPAVQSWLSERKLRRPLEVRQSGQVSSPLTYGILRPVILLPKDMERGDEAALTYILTHEFVHIRRFDAVTKLVFAAALCVHWFNPMAWVMYVLANRDMELSCDECVMDMLGGKEKAPYALTLIAMEEVRSRGLSIYNHFSKLAIEERIEAIMKYKKASILAIALAASLVLGATTAFAASAQTGNATPENGQDSPSNVENVIKDSTLMSYVNPDDGKTYYSWDEGQTFEPMTDEEVKQRISPKVEWWTAEEYAAWLEQEKIDLQSIIGSKGWTPSTGWFTWTQEMVDGTIAQYEQTLKAIQNGMKISKPTTDGDTMIQFGYDPDAQTSVTDTQVAVGYAEKLESISGDDVSVGYKQQLTSELLAEYKVYGLTYDEASKTFSFNGKLVRWFFDGYDIENGTATIYDYVNEDGVVDVRAVRQATQNADGSTNPGGKLAGIEEVSQEEFNSRFIMTPQMAQEATALGFVGAAGGETFERRFAMYKDFGITYVEADGASGRGNVYLNGQLVSHFADVTPNGDVFSFSSAEQGGIKIQTVYGADGKLTGFETITG